MNLFLIRHAVSEWNEIGLIQGCKDPGLSPKGKKQAEALGASFKAKKLDAIYSSPLTRAADTAKALAKHTGAQVYYDDLLREIAFGAWEGLTYSQICREYPEQIKVWDSRPYDCVVPGSENLPSVMERCKLFIEHIKSSHISDETIAIVSHTQPIKCMLSYLLGLPYNDMHAFSLKNASYAFIKLNDGGAVLTELTNNKEHMDTEQ